MICREEPLVDVLCALVGILLGIALAGLCEAVNAFLLVLKVVAHG